jgi:DNA-binding CsgD family transcriptional regulator
VVGGWRLVGRREELRRIAQARQHGAGGVLLVGEAGVGKTRLATEALVDAQGDGAVTARAVATRAAADIPLGALAPLVPALHEGTNPLVAGRQALRALAGDGDGPLVLLVDDGHLLDDISATLVLQVAARREAFVVVTARAGGRVPEPVTALWKDGHADRIDLPALGDAEVDELTAAILGDEVDPAAARAVRVAAEGNALAVRELVLAARESGALRWDGDRWRLDGSLPISARLVELVEQRVGSLSDEETEALEYLALGEPIGVALLDGLASPEVVASLERKGLLEARQDGLRFEAWLAHPFHGEVLRTQMTAVRTRRARLALADAVERSGSRRRGDLLRIATWRLEAGGAAQPDLLLRAARQSLRAFDYDAAARLAGAAWGRERSWEIGATYGLALSLLNRHEEADTVLGDTEPLAATDDERAAVSVARAEVLFFSRHREAEARRVLDAALVELTEGDARAEVIAYRASIDVSVGRLRRAHDAVAGFLAGSSARPLVAATIVAVPVLFCDGQTTAARELAERARQVHATIWQHGLFYQPPEIHLYNLALTLIEEGRLADAHALARQRFERCEETGRLRGVAWYRLVLSRISLGEGRVQTATTHARAADELMRGLDYDAHRRMALAHLVLALALAGDLAAARDAQAACDELCPLHRIYDPFVVEGRAWLAAAEGRLGDARAVLDQGAEEAIALGQAGLATHLLHGLARLGDPAAALDRLGDLAASRQAPPIPIRLAHARALVDGDGEGLEAVGDAFEAAGARLLAAEALADASRAWRRTGEPRRGTAAANRAQALAARCEGARTPALAGLDAATPLTDREREVALLAARGRPSRAIADQLFLSERTVENHLQRIYVKLGVRGRSELTAALDVDPD